MSPYPDLVIMNILEDQIHPGTLILDAGSGPSIGLLRYVRQKNGRYFSFDNNQIMLSQQRNSYRTMPGFDLDNHAISQTIASVTDFPYGDKTFDIINMRFVLAHIPPQRWKRIIEESVRTAKGKTIISEHDWATLKSTKHPELIDVIKKTSTDFAQTMGIDLYAGSTVPQAIITDLLWQK